VRSFTDSDLPDTGKLVSFENTTSINVVDLLCVLLLCPIYRD